MYMYIRKNKLVCQRQQQRRKWQGSHSVNLIMRPNKSNHNNPKIIMETEGSKQTVVAAKTPLTHNY